MFALFIPMVRGKVSFSNPLFFFMYNLVLVLCMDGISLFQTVTHLALNVWLQGSNPELVI